MTRARILANRGGVSLIEIVVCVLIVGILAAVAAPKLSQGLADSRADMAEQRVRADLRYAQRLARSTGVDCTITFNVAADSYTISARPGLDRPSSPYTVYLSKAPYSTNLVSADIGGDANVVYCACGVPDSDGTIVIQSGGRQVTVPILETPP